jgi:hypothetical protein
VLARIITGLSAGAAYALSFKDMWVHSNHTIFGGWTSEDRMPWQTFAPFGALPAERRQFSITSRGTGRSEKSRTVRRRAISAWKSAARRITSSSARISRDGSGINFGWFTEKIL